MSYNLIVSYSSALPKQISEVLRRPTVEIIHSLRSMDPRSCFWGTSAGRRFPCPEAPFREANTSQLRDPLFRFGTFSPYRSLKLLKGGFESGLNCSRLAMGRVEPQLNPYLLPQGGLHSKRPQRAWWPDPTFFSHLAFWSQELETWQPKLGT
jgi:hypothetical protein